MKCLVTKLSPLCIGVHNCKGINHDLFLMKDLSILGNKTSLLSGIKLPQDVNSAGFLNMTIQNPHSLKFRFNECWQDNIRQITVRMANKWLQGSLITQVKFIIVTQK